MIKLECWKCEQTISLELDKFELTSPFEIIKKCLVATSAEPTAQKILQTSPEYLKDSSGKAFGGFICKDGFYFKLIQLENGQWKADKELESTFSDECLESLRQQTWTKNWTYHLNWKEANPTFQSISFFCNSQHRASYFEELQINDTGDGALTQDFQKYIINPS